jgi:hypothetical protein
MEMLRKVNTFFMGKSPSNFALLYSGAAGWLRTSLFYKMSPITPILASGEELQIY